MARITIPPYGSLARMGDRLLNPLMRVLMGLNNTPGESPNLTHRWNNLKLDQAEIAKLDQAIMVTCKGDPMARRLNGLLRHMPIIGWQQYAVVQPLYHPEIEWYPGWHAPDVTGLSRLRQRGPVKLLRGPDDVRFTGFDLSGRQLPVEIVGYGRLGYGNQYAKLPLL